MKLEEGPGFDGIFRQGHGVEVVSDDDQAVVLRASTSVKVGDDDDFTDFGIRIEVTRPDPDDEDAGDISLVSLLLDADEANALAESLRISAAELRDGSFERESREDAADDDE